MDLSDHDVAGCPVCDVFRQGGREESVARFAALFRVQNAGEGRRRACMVTAWAQLAASLSSQVLVAWRTPIRCACLCELPSPGAQE
eukprot:11159312-Lingulodinium_polyedra.AAC.1